MNVLNVGNFPSLEAMEQKIARKNWNHKQEKKELKVSKVQDQFKVK